MKGTTLILLFSLVLSFQSCNSPKQETSQLSTKGEESFLSVGQTWCYEINEGKPFNKPVKIDKGFFGTLAVRTKVDTINLKLTDLIVIRAILKNDKDSLVYVDFQNFDFYKEPSYPKELLEIMPQVKKYLKSIKVEKKSIDRECIIPSLTVPVKIK